MSPAQRPGWAWIAMLVGVIGLLPGLAHRVAVEDANRTYELSITLPELESMRSDGVPLDRSLDRLAQAGLRSVEVGMVMIRDLERDGAAALLDRSELLSLLLLSGEPPDLLPDEGDSFLVLGEGSGDVVDRLRRAAPDGEVVEVTIAGRTMYRISGIDNVSILPLGYDDELMASIIDHGLAVIARVPNTVSGAGFAIAELERLQRKFGIDRFHLIGETAPFQSDPADAAALVSWLRENRWTMVFTNLGFQAGAEAYATLDRVTQLRLLGLSPDAYDRPITDALRAVRERRTRIITVRPQPALPAEERLDLLVGALADIQAAAPDGFAAGLAQPLEPVQAEPLLIGASVVAAGAAAAALGGVVGTPYGIGMGLAAGGLVALAAASGSQTLGNLARLAVAGLAALLALAVARPRPGLGAMTLEYAKAGAVVIGGGLIVSALGQDTALLNGTRIFWGVKALLLGPAAVVAAVALYLSLGRPRPSAVLPILNLPIRFWHVLAAGLVVGVIGFMLIRSGNSSIQIDIELVMREQLEDLFVVRPRTKEFLVGWPFLLLGIGAAWRSRHGWWPYAVAAIGTASAINTFTHYHSPLLISLARTVIGLALGYAVGLVLLGIVQVGLRAVRRMGPSATR